MVFSFAFPTTVRNSAILSPSVPNSSSIPPPTIMTAPAFVTSGSTALTSGLTHAAGTSVHRPRSARRPPCPRFTMSASRKFLVGGNWKCNLTKAAISDLVSAFNAASPLDPTAVEVVIAPPAIYLDSTRQILRDDFAISAQNVWVSAGGAYTGELDATMISDVGGDWTILGHSERRHHPVLKESDATIAEKAKYALETAGLNVMYCIGELLEERQSGNTVAVCERQLAALAATVSDWSKIVIAYEPVWAIGTGEVATPEQAEEVHFAVRKWLEKNVGKGVAEATRILYGGSVSPANCEELAKKGNIDGFLVGGASMQPSFLEIVDSYKTAMAATV